MATRRLQYAAQKMFSPYDLPRGTYGRIPVYPSYGAFEVVQFQPYGGLDPISGIIEGVTGLTGVIVGAITQGKQAKLGREHELEMAQQERKTLKEQQKLAEKQAELAALEAQEAAASSKATIAVVSWMGGTVLILGLAGLGLHALNKSRH